MSHWVILTLGMVEQPLADAYKNKDTDFEKWIATAIDEIEKLGNQNPSNSGFILLKEEPGEDGLSGIVIHQSIDWRLSEIIKNLPALQRFKTQDPKRFIELKKFADRTIRQALTEALHHQVQLLAEKLTRVPTYRLAGMTDDDLHVIDSLLAVAEDQTPPFISFMQLYVEDRLDFVLGKNSEQLIEFHKLPIEKQKAARRNIVELFGWQHLYPELSTP